MCSRLSYLISRLCGLIVIFLVSFIRHDKLLLVNKQKFNFFFWHLLVIDNKKGSKRINLLFRIVGSALLTIKTFEKA